MKKITLVSICLFCFAISIPIYGKVIEEKTLFKIDLPEGFKHAFTSDIGRILKEYIAEDETVEDWSEMITTIKMPSKQLTAIGAWNSIGKLWIQSCSKIFEIRINEPKIFEVKGYQAVRGAMHCGYNVKTKKGEYTDFLFIKIKEEIYSIQRAIRFDPIKYRNTTPLANYERRQWDKFFAEAKICPAEECMKINE